MSETAKPQASMIGASFLLHPTDSASVFTPEDFSDEHQQIAATAAEFAAKEVLPATIEIEAKNFSVTRALLKKAGDLGLMAVDVPEAYGGLAMDKVTSAIVADRMAMLASFSVAFSAHTGIGTLPIVWYGTEEQKQKYLPKLASGEWIAAYALSEATSGSDAMNIRTRAVKDGNSYVLNGEKMWITNAGFADLFTVFAKVADPAEPDLGKAKMSAFLIERNTPGLAIGAEEHKMGIRGSSTCPLVLNECRISAGNLLGEEGKGHHIAFNILNIGRFKLGAACVGGARTTLANAIQYARDRKAFGKSITEFGLIQEKIADAVSRIYVAESMTYRTIGAIDAALASAEDANEIQKRIEEFAIECSVLKVWGSEMLDTVVDHAVQIYAGYGYVEEYPAERAYRDSRINRIFEGTNEINRLIISGFVMKRAMEGRLAMLPAMKALMEELTAPPAFLSSLNSDAPLAREETMLANAKKLFLFASGAASRKYLNNMADQQEIMAALAEMILEIYALDSALARARKLAASDNAKAPLAQSMTQFCAEAAFQTAERSARKVLSAVAEGDALRTQLAVLRRLAKHEPADTISLGRIIAKAAIELGSYPI